MFLNIGPTTLVCGASGVGKSALVLSELSAAVETDPLQLQVIFLNLRLLPSTIAGLRSAIGSAIQDVLWEMSAPVRLLVIDAADYIGESNSDLLHHIVRAAKDSDVSVWIISSTEGRVAVRAVIEIIFTSVIEHEISFLTDEDLREVVAVFPQLGSLVANPHSKGLLRRPVIADLLVRAGPAAAHPLSDTDALTIVWTRLIRSSGRFERGRPDARDQVFRHLARHQLHPGPTDALLRSLDLAALDGLRRDGLVRSASEVPWQVVPDFSHELLRTYAVCQVLLADGEPVSVLLAAGAPRWALPAARLAAQVLLAAADHAKVPTEQRFEKIQEDFDRLAAAGHGQRWSDLPTEAVLPLPQAGKLLDEAWDNLLKENAQGLRRVLRVMQQRHRAEGLVAALVAEPVVDLLLGCKWPADRDLKKEIEELLCDWLRALIVANTPAGHRLRLKLRHLIVESVKQGDHRLAKQAARKAAELASRSPGQARDDERQKEELERLRPPWVAEAKQRLWGEIPAELLSKSTLEKLSLLGADLGEEGEELLRRIARDAPSHYLAPCLEETLAGQGIASYRPSLLIGLVEMYYIEERDGWELSNLNYGIRSHDHGGGFGPLAAFYLGPFLAMFRYDFRAGVACLNRLLNHAAKVRAAVLQDGTEDGSESAEASQAFRVVLSITGETRIYVGDSHVWRWYRGTGVGPYPCMSALQALEVVCDQLMEAGAPLDYLTTIMLEGCENLAMLALLVGLIVRHLEQAGAALDPFLAEPSVWYLEFDRVVAEHSVLAANREGLRAPERRKWSLREAAMLLVLQAEDERLYALRKLGQCLIERAQASEEAKPGSTCDGEGSSLSERLAAVHTWAAILDRDLYQVTEQADGLLIKPAIAEDVQQALEPGNRDLGRGNQVMQLLLRYGYHQHNLAGAPIVSPAEFQSDLAIARELLDDPPAASPSGPLAAPAAVAAGALELCFIAGESVASEDLVWSVQLLVQIAKLCAIAEPEYFLSQYTLGPDRSAARGIPFVLLPAAATLRAGLSASGLSLTDLADAAQWLATSAPLETRVFYAKALDLAWRAPCDHEDPAECHHGYAVELVEASARDSAIGKWNPSIQASERERLAGSLVHAIADVLDEKIIVPNLSPAIRALGVAASTPNCCAGKAKVLLAALLAAHGRGRIARLKHYTLCASDTLIVARALLVQAANNSEELLWAQVGYYSDHADLLAELLRALAAVAEENHAMAEAALRIWPKLMNHVLDASDGKRHAKGYGYSAADDIAALIPKRVMDYEYLRRELEAEPVDWINLIAWRSEVERWTSHAVGSSRCVDSLVAAITTLTVADQAALGLPWIEALVQADPGRIASRSWLLPNWLRELRPHASHKEISCWQRIVDMLIVAGDTRVADLSD